MLRRPIVSFVNTFARDFSAHLIDILAPLKEKSDYKVKNLAHFVYSINCKWRVDETRSLYHSM